MILDADKKVKDLSTPGYIDRCDICEHFSLILKYGKQCDHITEMGVRNVVSTWGWIASRPKKFICYDIRRSSNIIDAQETAESLGIDFTFHEADTRKIEIEETDLLFVDTEHTYEQMSIELTLHGNKARKFIIFHDTAHCDDMNVAIKEFMEANPHWVDEEEVMNNNGFKIIKRI
jgi:hypothetical protein